MMNIDNRCILLCVEGYEVFIGPCLIKCKMVAILNINMQIAKKCVHFSKPMPTILVMIILSKGSN